MPEIVTFGEAMVRLSPPHFQRLEQARSFDVEVGGAELNTAVGLARLGHSAAWVSRLPDSPLGRLVANRAREAGVSTESVRFAGPDERVGVYYLEQGAAPRASSVVYDRKDSAVARLTPGEFDWPALFAGAKWFHLSGITPALSPAAARAARDALDAAKAAGLTTSLDLNYRSKLWSEADAGRWFNEALDSTDVLIASVEDARKFFRVASQDFEEVGRKLTTLFGVRVVAAVVRETPLVWRNTFGAVAYSNGQLYRTRVYDVEIVDRLGAGDAFAAGLIDGLLADDLRRGMDLGAALGALKHSVPGDFPWLTRAEAEAVTAGGGLRVSR